MAVQRKTKSHMRSKKMISKKKSSLKRDHQKGGSPASNLVNEAVKAHPHVKNDFVTSPRIREGPMKGGSKASDMVMSHLNADAKTNSFFGSKPIKGNMDSLNLYQPSGGSRKSKRKSRKSKGKSRKSSKSNGKSRKSRRVRKMKGGGSDWISSQYSLGSYNQAEMSAEDVAKFSQSAAGARADYMNPPTLGLAGSGSPMNALEGANVNKAGAPLV
tara:strand:+ start:68 stop:712 length:645 start_codon:yes stop_codon:yes gene_type:complete